ncbi:carboxypeptidase-like regulatory domain-containing protein [Tepidibacter sp. Z1-5]|uniref:carboxypeptidase-like regulatory domain-containing protein n=1 Tax=Tepidibacter sp. Z1-5 TaxID=3134138 RepID=UPI0030C63DD7
MGARLVKFGFNPTENEQIDAVIKVGEEKRGIIHGIVKDSKDKIVKDAVVELFEIVSPPRSLKSLTYAFTDEYGEFLFGPLSPNKNYVVKVWFNNVNVRDLIIEHEHDEPHLDKKEIQPEHDEPRCDKKEIQPEHDEPRCDKKEDEFLDDFEDEL